MNAGHGFVEPLYRSLDLLGQFLDRDIVPVQNLDQATVVRTQFIQASLEGLNAHFFLQRGLFFPLNNILEQRIVKKNTFALFPGMKTHDLVACNALAPGREIVDLTRVLKLTPRQTNSGPGSG